MSKNYEYYVILFDDDLTYYTNDGYPSQDISQAIQYTNLTVAQQDIDDLDDDYKKCAVIYKVTEIREYKLEKKQFDN